MSSPTLDQHSAFLLLASLPGVGYWRLRKLLIEDSNWYDRFKDRDYAALAPLAEELGIRRASDIRDELKKVWGEAQKTTDLLHERGVRLIFSEEAQFPASLRAIPEPPLWLFVRGDSAPLHAPSVAVVGTRQPSPQGLFLTELVCRLVGDLRVPIVSGLALGIDQLAHRTALTTGVPTVAVLGTGILENYPTGAHDLKDAMVAGGGCLVTEYLPKQSYSAENFVRRNRIQAALSPVLIPAEWQAKSGTSHTVRFASDYKRRLVCVRVHEWPDDREEFIVARKQGGKVFLLPNQQTEFLEEVRTALEPVRGIEQQLEMFGTEELA